MKGLLAVLALSVFSHAFSAPVKLTITNTGGQAGLVRIAVFDDARYFPDHTDGIIKAVYARAVKGQTSTVATIDLPPGTYAFNMYLDEARPGKPDGNGKLDTNFIGIPTERYGCTTNPGFAPRAPHFDECDVTVPAAGAEYVIKLRKLL